MPFRRTLLAASLALLITGQAPLYAAPPLSMDNGSNALTVQNSNAWVEVSASALQHNIRTLQAELGGKSKLCAVLKADAYGHGIGLVMPSVIALGVPCVAVASNEEARVVRASGFTGQLVRVRLASLSELEDALQYDMEELVGSAEFARQADAIAERHGKTLRIHLALNSSGMSRNGVEMASWSGRGEALQVTDQKHLKLVALMTHFAVEDKDDVRKGLAAFNQQADWLIKHAKLDRSQLTLHAANSFATLEVPEARLDMVRTGGALFGDTVPARTEYQRAMQFKSRVAAVHSYPAGNTVGYDRTFTLARDARLANITVGYSDGYRRVFTNKGHVLINGHRVPVVGKVSMNTLMVDVTDFPDVKNGNEVVLFGKQAGGEITLGEMEDINGALLADLYTVWGSSNPKILVD